MNQCTREPMTVQVVERAMKQHDGLVHAFIQRQGGGDIPYEEALQAGRMGLWRAIQGYDPARGTTFSTYAWVAIYRWIHRRAKELRRDTDVWMQDLSASGGMPDPVEEVDRELSHDALHDLVNRLPQRLGWVIVRRYGLGEEPPCTLKELGEEMGLSGERVRQLQQEALAWLRQPAHSWHLRQLVGKNSAADYRHALAQNAALRRARRQRS